MDNHSGPSLLSANRIDDGIVIEFSDGRAAFYPSALLYRVLPEATEIEVPADEDDAAG